MASQLSYYFLLQAQQSLSEVNKVIGRAPGTPDGELQADASDQDARLLEAVVQLTEALELFENWAVELSVRLEDAGVVELVREEP